MDFSFSDTSISYDWFILALRLVFIGLIYIFLYQVMRVTLGELVRIGSVAPSSSVPAMHNATMELEVVDPAESPLHAGDHLPLSHYTTIGRRPDNALVIADSFVSAQHAEIVFESGSWWVTDLGSTNGTFVNSLEITQRTAIERGDIVQFGRVVTRLIP